MNPITRAILIGGIALLVAGSAGAVAQTFPLECAQRDAQIINQTEQHGDTRDMPGDIRYDGLSTMKHSRNACYLGRVVVGHAADDSAFQSLADLAPTR
jgi:hypothetical protein